MRKEELKTYIENHESEMIEDLKSLIRIPSEKQAAEPGKPFGAPAAEALAQGSRILEKYGFAVTNYDNYAIAADFNGEEKGLDILAHLDVVPAGEGWQETDPFTPLVKDGKMFGRGTADDKGPAIAAIYAMRAVKELGFPLKKNVRSSSAPMRNAEVPILNTIIKKKQKRHAPSLRTRVPGHQH